MQQEHGRTEKPDKHDEKEIIKLLEKHIKYTSSVRAKAVLAEFRGQEKIFRESYADGV